MRSNRRRKSGQVCVRTPGRAQPATTRTFPALGQELWTRIS
jgi:hypothetical protein